MPKQTSTILEVPKQDKGRYELKVTIPSRLYDRFRAFCQDLESDEDYVLERILDQSLPLVKETKRLTASAESKNGHPAPNKEDLRLGASHPQI